MFPSKIIIKLAKIKLKGDDYLKISPNWDEENSGENGWKYKLVRKKEDSSIFTVHHLKDNSFAFSLVGDETSMTEVYWGGKGHQEEFEFQNVTEGLSEHYEWRVEIVDDQKAEFRLKSFRGTILYAWLNYRIIMKSPNKITNTESQNENNTIWTFEDANTGSRRRRSSGKF